MKEYVLKWFDGYQVHLESFWNALEYSEFRRFLISNEIMILGGGE